MLRILKRREDIKIGEFRRRILVFRLQLHCPQQHARRIAVSGQL